MIEILRTTYPKNLMIMSFGRHFEVLFNKNFVTKFGNILAEIWLFQLDACKSMKISWKILKITKNKKLPPPLFFSKMDIITWFFVSEKRHNIYFDRVKSKLWLQYSVFWKSQKTWFFSPFFAVFSKFFPPRGFSQTF